MFPGRVACIIWALRGEFLKLKLDTHGAFWKRRGWCESVFWGVVLLSYSRKAGGQFINSFMESEYSIEKTCEG